MNTLMNQPDEILRTILGFVDGLDIMRLSQVNHKFANLVEQYMIKPVYPSIEECIQTDYYHFRKYLLTQLTNNQKQLIKLFQNEILIKHFKIDIKVDINTLLVEYSGLGNIEIVKLLLEEGADLHADNDHALRWSALNGHTEIVKLLLEKGADVNSTNYPFFWSIVQGHLEVVKLLLEKGANVHADNDYAICLCAERGYLEIVKLLIENRADIHTNNDRALRLSAQYGHIEVVKLLLEKGADIHADNDFALRNSIGEVHEYLKKLINQ